MFSKVNIFKLVSDHVKTLYDYSDSKKSWSDLFLFFGAPILVGVIFLFAGLSLSDSIIGVLVGGYTILTGLLFNLLLIVFDFIKKHSELSADPQRRACEIFRLRLLKETFANMSFCSLLSIILACLATLRLFHVEHTDKPLDFVIYVGSINFILTLLMILKRVHAIVSHEFTIYDSKHGADISG